MEERMKKIIFEFGNEYRGKVESSKIYYIFNATAYLTLKLKENNITDYKGKSFDELLNMICDDDIRCFVKECLDGYFQIESLDKWSNISNDDLKNFIINSKMSDINPSPFVSNQESSTPECILDLAIKILDIKDNERVIDCCSGVGNFLLQSNKSCNNAEYYGVEINEWNVCINKIRAEVSCANIKIINADCFDYNNKDNGFDKAFSNHPLGLRIRSMVEGSDYLKGLYRNNPEIIRGTSSDWVYNYKLLDLLNESGKAVAIMTLGGLWNTLDRQIREYFLRINKIEAIITLPERLLLNTAIPVAMIVLNNKKENTDIRFVNASKEYVAGRRQNTLSVENIDKIVNSLDKDSEISKSVNVETIIKEEFSFNPMQYIAKKIEIENGVSFESVIKSITRGAYSSAKEFDTLSSAVPTEYQYLMLANIKNGMIDKELPYLKTIPEAMDKYCLKTGDLIISKNGYPFKVAVAEVKNNKKILANGNLYIIELDKEKVNPYYLQAFFESDIGIASLKSIVVGATIPNIGLSSLKKLNIPMVSKEKQDEIANKYLATMDEISLYKRKIEKAENSLRTIFTID